VQNCSLGLLPPSIVASGNLQDFSLPKKFRIGMREFQERRLDGRGDRGAEVAAFARPVAFAQKGRSS
jgi:hypothetical protein